MWSLLISIMYILFGALILYILFKYSLKYNLSNNLINSLRNTFNTDNLCHYNKILDNLFIGNLFTARDKEFITKNNIDIVLNITSEIPNYFYCDKNIKYYKLNISDTTNEYDQKIMMDNLHNFVKIIDKNLSENLINNTNHNILVHCYAGKSRSATVIAAYLIYKFNMTPDDAIKFIINKRSCAFNNGERLIFYDVLNKYYKLKISNFLN
jgi:protein-tyrosine phosphatase